MVCDQKTETVINLALPFIPFPLIGKNSLGFTTVIIFLFNITIIAKISLFKFKNNLFLWSSFMEFLFLKCKQNLLKSSE